MIVLQLLIYCLLFTAMVKIAVIGGAVNGLYLSLIHISFPPPLWQRGFAR